MKDCKNPDCVDGFIVRRERTGWHATEQPTRVDGPCPDCTDATGDHTVPDEVERVLVMLTCHCTDSYECIECRGIAMIRDRFRAPVREPETCWECDGTGETFGDFMCPTCGGTGTAPVREPDRWIVRWRANHAEAWAPHHECSPHVSLENAEDMRDEYREMGRDADILPVYIGTAPARPVEKERCARAYELIRAHENFRCGIESIGGCREHSDNVLEWCQMCREKVLIAALRSRQDAPSTDEGGTE